MGIADVDLFYEDLSGKLAEAYNNNERSITISIAGEAALREAVNNPDYNLGEEEVSHRQILLPELDEMLKQLKKKLPELRREYLKVTVSNDRVPIDWPRKPTGPREHLKLISC